MIPTNKKIMVLALLIVLVVGAVFAAGCTQSSREKTESKTSYSTVTKNAERTEKQQTQSTGAQDDAGSGDDVAGNTKDAYPLSEGIYTGTLKEGDNADVYVVRMGPDDILKVTLTPDAGLDVGLGHCASGETVDVLSTYVENHGAKGEKETYLRIPNRNLNYYIAAVREGGSGMYELKIEMIRQNDAKSGGDAPKNLADAVQLKSGTYKGFLGQEDSADSYFIRIDPGDIVSVNVIPSSRFDVQLWTGLDNDLKHHDRGLKGEAENELFVNGEMNSIYYIAVSTKEDDDVGGYTLSVSVSKQNDAGSGGDAPKDIDNAVQINAGTYRGYLGQNDERDIYVLKISAGDIVRVNVAPSSDLDVIIAAADSPDDVYFEIDDGLKGEPETVWFVNSERESPYYIGVSTKNYRDMGDYTVNVSVTGQNDANSGLDAPGDVDNALLINAGTYSGYIGGKDEEDFYVVKLSPGEVINVKVTPSNNLDVMLAATPNTDDIYFDHDTGLKGEPESTAYTAEGNTNYYIGIRYKGGVYAGSYTLEISITSP